MSTMTGSAASQGRAAARKKEKKKCYSPSSPALPGKPQWPSSIAGRKKEGTLRFLSFINRNGVGGGEKKERFST